MIARRRRSLAILSVSSREALEELAAKGKQSWPRRTARLMILYQKARFVSRGRSEADDRYGMINGDIRRRIIKRWVLLSEKNSTKFMCPVSHIRSLKILNSENKKLESQSGTCADLSGASFAAGPLRSPRMSGQACSHG